MRTPWHLWVVGALALIWTAGGAADYVMTRYGVEAYLAHMTAPQQAYLEGFPVWVGLCWALGVWGGVLGALALLIQLRWAGTLFPLSLAGIIGTSAYGYLLADPPLNTLMGPVEAAFSPAIFVVAVLLLIYARAMRRPGVLR
jgi:hypothetical protein